jgi:MYXO-CTERM domain-containing protein
LRDVVRAGVVVLLLLAGPLAPPARAQPSGKPTVTLAPVRAADAPARERAYVVKTVRPGQTFTDRLTATNLTDAPLPVVLDAVDAEISADGQFAPAADGVRGAAGGWIGLPRRSMTLPPRSGVQLEATFRVPADATSGDHLAAVTIEKRTPTPVGDGIAVRMRVAVRVYLTVTGGAAAPAARFAISRLEFTGTPAEPGLAVTVSSTGGRLVEPLGAVRLRRGPLGQDADLPVLGTVPAGGERTFAVPLRGPLEPGSYAADLSLWLADGTNRTSARTTFEVGGPRNWAPVVVPALLLLLLLVLLLLLRRRRKVSAERRRARGASANPRAPVPSGPAGS